MPTVDCRGYHLRQICKLPNLPDATKHEVLGGLSLHTVRPAALDSSAQLGILANKTCHQGTLHFPKTLALAPNLLSEESLLARFLI